MSTTINPPALYAQTLHTYNLHPVVIFSILDHYKRRPVNATRVVGTLMGEVDGKRVIVKQAFPVPHQEDQDQVAVDMEYHQTMLALHKQVNPREVVVGWYSTGNELTYISSLMHEVYRGQTPNGVEPVLITVDVAMKNFSLGVQGWTSNVVTRGSEQVLAKFERVKVEMQSFDEETIGVDALINGEPDDLSQLDSPATILRDVDNLQHALHHLLDSIKVVSDYVERVASGEVKGDPELGLQIATALSTIPAIEPAAFAANFNTHLHDLLMLMYLANLTKTQLAIADKANVLL